MIVLRPGVRAIPSTSLRRRGDICQLNMAISSCLHRVEESWTARVDEMSRSHVDHPARMTLPNGRSSIRWRKASPASLKG